MKVARLYALQSFVAYAHDSSSAMTKKSRLAQITWSACAGKERRRSFVKTIDVYVCPRQVSHSATQIGLCMDVRAKVRIVLICRPPVDSPSNDLAAANCEGDNKMLPVV